MVDQYYALREFALLREKSESLSLYALVDGIQFDRFFNESLKEIKVFALFSVYRKIRFLLLPDHGC